MKLHLILFSFLVTMLAFSCAPKNTINGTGYIYQYFQFGVASGDPSETSVVLWTAIEHQLSSKESIKWKISESKDMKGNIQKGETRLTSSDSKTVKVKIDGLEPGKRYYYQFNYNGENSPVGRTKTLATNPEELKIGIVSCSNFEAGYFNAYESLAKKDVDVIVHLGDYIYEYGPGTYGDTSLTRTHIPNHEIIKKEDYRKRYAQYRKDPALQLVHQNHPFITIWDDHEIANDAYETGAQNHQEEEGAYADRVDIAKQVYHEWLPTDLSKDDNLYRTFSFGNFAEMIMLDGRLAGRSKQLKEASEHLENQSMLGSEQLGWLKNNLKSSKASWKIIGNQVIFSPTDLSRVREESFNMDAWDGYAGERNNIVDYIDQQDISNVLILTGDTHMSWAFEVPQDLKRLTYKPVAIEIGTPSITSSNINESVATEDAIFMERMLMASNPHIKYVDGRNHGYAILTLQKDTGFVDWYHVSNLKSTEYVERKSKTLHFDLDGENKLY